MKLNQVFMRRSKHLILDDLQLELPCHGVTVLLGANGAGKSSLLSVLAGISTVDSGALDMAGIERTFLMPEPASFYPHLTVVEQLEFVAGLFAVENQDNKIRALVDDWQLGSVQHKLTRQLSLGYRQRLSLAQLDLSAADLLLLDEPMNGMDPELMQLFKQHMEVWKTNKTVVMATHIMHEAQEFADWVVVMASGQIKYSAPYQAGSELQTIYQSALVQNHKVGRL